MITSTSGSAFILKSIYLNNNLFCLYIKICKEIKLLSYLNLKL